METNDHTPPTTDRPDDGVPTDRRPLGFWLRLTDRQLSAAFADEFEAEGLDRRDWMLLNLLAGDVADDRLARFVASGPHRGGKRLRRMAERGWITRTDDGWALTDAGRAQRDVLKTRVDAIRDRVAGAISPEDYATVVASLEAIAREFGWDGGERMPRGPRGRFSHRPGRAEWHGRGPWAFDREGRGNAHRGFGPDFGPARDHHACGPHGAHGAHGHHKGHGAHGHGHGAHGHGAHGHHKGHGGREYASDSAYERGFVAGFSAAHPASEN